MKSYNLQDDEKVFIKENNLILRYWHKFKALLDYDSNLIEKEPSFYYATSGANPEEQFIVKDRCTSYNSAQRSLMVMQILLRTRYDETEKVDTATRRLEIFFFNLNFVILDWNPEIVK